MIGEKKDTCANIRLQKSFVVKLKVKTRTALCLLVTFEARGEFYSQFTQSNLKKTEGNQKALAAFTLRVVDPEKDSFVIL